VEDKKLVSLKEYNEKKRADFKCKEQYMLNGIACPNCGKEMWESTGKIQLQSLPPQKPVFCKACGLRDTRVL
jgi:transcription elongation factor Elf1